MNISCLFSESYILEIYMKVRRVVVPYVKPRLKYHTMFGEVIFSLVRADGALYDNRGPIHAARFYSQWLPLYLRILNLRGIHLRIVDIWIFTYNLCEKDVYCITLESLCNISGSKDQNSRDEMCSISLVSYMFKNGKSQVTYLHYTNCERQRKCFYFFIARSLHPYS